MSQPQVDLCSIFDIQALDLDGNFVKIDSFNEKCLLIVNIASNCKTMRSNIEGLRRLKQTLANELTILLFPCNQFMGWSQKDTDEIKTFLTKENIDFAEVFSMVDVNGSETHPVYKFLKKQCSGVITSNFVKFFVNKSGKCQKFNSYIGFSTLECEIKKMM